MERSAPIIFAYHPLFGFALTVACVIGATVAAKTLDGSEDQTSYLILCWSLSASLFSVPLAFKYVYEELVEWSKGVDHFVISDTKDVEKWFLQRLSIVRGSTAMYVAAIAFGVVAAAIVYWSVLRHYKSTYAIWIAVAIVFWSEFLAAAALYLMYCVGRAIWDIGMLPGTEVRVEAHQFGVLSTGTLLFRCSLAALTVWTFYQIPVLRTLLIAHSDLWAIVVSPPVIGLTIPTIGVVLAFFIISQIPLHRRMIETKRREIGMLEAMLDELRPKKVEEISDELMRKVVFVSERLKNVESLPEWPFSKTSAYYTGLSSVVSVIGSAGFSKVLQSLIKPFVGSVPLFYDG